MTDYNAGHRKRLKKRFSEHSESVFDYELLEVLIGYAVPRKDVKPFAKSLLYEYGDLESILHEDVSLIAGLGSETEILFKAIREYVKRIEKEKSYSTKYSVDSPESIFPFLKQLIGKSHQEKFMIVFLDGQNSIIDHSILSVGTVNQAAVYPRESVKLALEKNAVSVLFAHNHPSGNLSPSDEDVALTKSLIEAFRLMDITVLDHLIVSHQSFSSLKKDGLM